MNALLFRKISLLAAALWIGGWLNSALAAEPLPAIAAGESSSFAVKEDGSLWAWGEGRYFQLGLGPVASYDPLTPVRVGKGFTAAAVGDGHSLALKADGGLWAWGLLNCLTGGVSQCMAPEQVGSGFTAIAAGWRHDMAVKADGGLWTWGRNEYGQLGDGTTKDRFAMVEVGSGFAAAAGGVGHSLGLKADGSLWAWGRNDSGQLGDGTTIDRLTPVQVGSGFIAIAAGGNHSLGLKADGSLWAWGDNYNGQLGDGTRTDRLIPVQVGSGFTAIAGGGYHSLALKADGSLWAWGSNYWGELGDGAATERLTPTQVGSGYAAIAAGTRHSLGVKADGSFWAWGSNDYGQLGDATTEERRTPVRIANLGTRAAPATQAFLAVDARVSGPIDSTDLAADIYLPFTYSTPMKVYIFGTVPASWLGPAFPWTSCIRAAFDGRDWVEIGSQTWAVPYFQKASAGEVVHFRAAGLDYSNPCFDLDYFSISVGFGAIDSRYLEASQTILVAERDLSNPFGQEALVVPPHSYAFAPDAIQSFGKALNLAGHWQIAGEDEGQVGNYYASFFDGASFLFLTPSGWQAWSGGPLPVLETGPLQSKNISIVQGVDVSPWPGGIFYIGYGRDEADMLSGKYGAVYTVP